MIISTTYVEIPLTIAAAVRRTPTLTIGYAQVLTWRYAPPSRYCAAVNAPLRVPRSTSHPARRNTVVTYSRPRRYSSFSRSCLTSASTSARPSSRSW